MEIRRIADPGTLAFARQLIRAERLRGMVLDEHFTAAEWQLLLELFVASEEGRLTAVTDLGLIEGLARSTALGIAADLTTRGLLERQADPHDGRRFFVSLEEGLHRRVNAFLLSLMQYLGGSDAPDSDP